MDTPKLCLLESNEQVQTKHGLGHICPNLVADDSHIIQIHTTNMDMFVSLLNDPKPTQFNYLQMQTRIHLIRLFRLFFFS